MAQIAVIGVGYVGLPTAAVLASFGHKVSCLDNSSTKVELLSQGTNPLLEEGLDDLLQKGISSGMLSFAVIDDPIAKEILSTTEFVFLCLPTPPTGDGSADLTAVEQVSKVLSPLLRSGSIIILKSTTPVGTSQRVIDIIDRSDVSLVFSPEFLREGKAVEDLLHPDRIVIGSKSKDSIAAVDSLFAKISSPRIFTNLESAEIIKYASNALLATKLSFINSISRFVDKTGAELDAVVEGVGLDHRIGKEFINPGPGWGGSCLPKDTSALAKTFQNLGLHTDLLKAVIEENDYQIQYLVNKIETLYGNDLSKAKLCLFGLAFKAGTNDLRDSPSLKLAKNLLSLGATLKAYDPAVSVSTQLDYDIEQCENPYEATDKTDLIIIGTEWPEFKNLDFEMIKNNMSRPLIVDTRNLLDRQALIALGFRYENIGFTSTTRT